MIPNPFSVIRIPFDFRDGNGAVRKRFVVLGHARNYCLCAKATSKVDRHRSDPSIMAGVVFFEAGEAECFECPTAIEPSNVFPIPHATLIQYERKGQVEILGILDDGFKGKMRIAVAACKTIDPKRKVNLLIMVIDGGAV